MLKRVKTKNQTKTKNPRVHQGRNHFQTGSWLLVIEHIIETFNLSQLKIILMGVSDSDYGEKIMYQGKKVDSD